jgi:hypothetical protein
MSGNCFDVTPFEKANADYALAQLQGVAPEGSIDAHFPGTFLHDLLVRHCLNVRALDADISVHMRRLYAALMCVASMKYHPYTYGEVLNQLCFITAALACPRTVTNDRKYGCHTSVDLGSSVKLGARTDCHGEDSSYLSSLDNAGGDNSALYELLFKDVRKAAQCGLIVKPKPSEVQFLLKKLAAYLPSRVIRKTGEDKNAQPCMQTSTTRAGKRSVEYVDSTAWAMLLVTVRQLPARPACFSEHMVSVRSLYSRLHKLRCHFATWAFAQPADFKEMMGEYDTTVSQFSHGHRTGMSLSLNCPFWIDHCQKIITAHRLLPSRISLDNPLFAR